MLRQMQIQCMMVHGTLLSMQIVSRQLNNTAFEERAHIQIRLPPKMTGGEGLTLYSTIFRALCLLLSIQLLKCEIQAKRVERNRACAQGARPMYHPGLEAVTAMGPASGRLGYRADPAERFSGALLGLDPVLLYQAGIGRNPDTFAAARMDNCRRLDGYDDRERPKDLSVSATVLHRIPVCGRSVRYWKDTSSP
jgi:hypothetical protein